MSRPDCSCPAHLSSSLKLSLLWKVLAMVSVFAGCEFAMGRVSHSLALKADSGHMLSDGLALAIALLATWLAQQTASPTSPVRSRIESGAALFNALGLLGMAGLIGWEAYEHLHAPPTDILSLPMLVTAVLGLVINGINVVLLHGTDAQDLNLRGAFLHVLADVISSVGVILAAIAVWIWDWTWADSAIGVGVSCLIGASALPLIRQSVQQLRSPRPLTSAMVSSDGNTNAKADADVQPGMPQDVLDTMGFCQLGQTSLITAIDASRPKA